MKTQYTKKKERKKTINNSHWKNVLDRVNVERERERERQVCVFIGNAFSA